MSESELQAELCKRLKRAVRDPATLRKITFAETSSSAKSMGDLLKSGSFKVFWRQPGWNRAKNQLNDIAGNMVPDIVIHSTVSDENRIFIEVKLTAGVRRFKQGVHDSQIVRYFLLLLGTTHEMTRPGDHRRALILAAPKSWIVNNTNRTYWQHLFDTYSPLAEAFGVTLARIEL